MNEGKRNGKDGFYCVEKEDGLLDFGRKNHANVEIVFVYEGEARVWVENRAAEKAESGDAIIIFPNQQYRYEIRRGERYALIRVDIRRLGELLGVLTSYTPEKNVIGKAMKDREIRQLLESVLGSYGGEESEYGDTVLKGYVTALLGRVLQMSELRKNGIEKTNTASEIMDFCNVHYREKLSLEYLERELHISKYYISHVINEKMGIGFNDYVNSIRINEAQKLLIESDKAIKEISAEVGFGTVRTFDRAFRKQKGETAREYRERNSEKNKKD